jgi:hypothetical protein
MDKLVTETAIRPDETVSDHRIWLGGFSAMSGPDDGSSISGEGN